MAPAWKAPNRGRGRNDTAWPTSMSRVPSAISMHWNRNRWSSAVTIRPMPLGSSNSVTVPSIASVDDLADRDLEQIGGAGLGERRDHEVDARLGHDALDRVVAIGELVDRRRFGTRQHRQHGVALVGRDIDLEQHLATRLEG